MNDPVESNEGAEAGSSPVPCSGVFVLAQPPTYHWEPKEDITTFELAKCQAMFVAGVTNYGEIRTVYEGLPRGAKRHWRIHPSQNPKIAHR